MGLWSKVKKTVKKATKQITRPIEKATKGIRDPITSAYDQFEAELKRTDPMYLLGGAALLNPALLAANLPFIAGGAAAYAAKEAGDKAKDVADTAAQAEQASTAEQVSRMEESNARSAALARARSAASGVSGTTSDIYIDALEKSGEEEVDWIKQVGATNYQARIDEGKSAYSQAQSQMWGQIGNLIPGVASTVRMFM